MTIADDLHETFLTQSLSEQQLAELMAVGDEITITEGDELFREGQPSDYMRPNTLTLERRSSGAASCR